MDYTMADEQRKQTTNTFVIGDLFSENGLDAELSQERMKEIKMLNDATEKLQWKKRFEGSEAKVLSLEKEIRKIMEAKGVLEGKISSARILMEGHLNDFPLTGETEGLFKNVLKVLNPDSEKCTCNCQGAQEKLTPDTPNDLSTVKTGSSLGISNTGTQNDLNIPVMGRKRRQDSEGSEVSQKKAHLEELPSSSTLIQQGQTRKPSNNSSVSKTPSKIGKSSAEDAPQIEIAQTPLLGPNSGSLTTANTLNMGKSAAEQRSAAPRDIITRGTNPRPPAQSGTLHLAKNGNEGSSLTPIQIAVKSFCKLLSKNKNLDDDTKSIIEKLCVRLKCDAVALKLAVSYINELLLVLGNPLKSIIESYFARINDEIIPGLVENPFYPTWRVTCKKIREKPGIGEKALKMLAIISFLAADNIPIQFVMDLYNLMENQQTSAIGGKILRYSELSIFQLLNRFSMTNSSSSGELISVHPLIQEATRNDLEEQEKFTEVLGRIQRSAHKIIQENDVSSQEMIHAESIWKHVSQRPVLIVEDGAFPSSICDELNKLGKYREALDFSCRVLPVLESSLGGKSRWTIAINYWKGVALEYLGEYSKALELLTEVYESQKELFGEEDEECLYTCNQIGLVQWRLEKYDEALKWYWHALEKRESIFGVEHPETLSLRHNIALVLKGQGKYEEAMQLYQQVLEVEEWVRGKEHRDTLTTKFNMATIRFSQGNYEDALKLLEEVLEGEERVLGVNNPDTLLTKEWIADTYGCLGSKEQAVKLYKEVLAKREKVLGAEHPDTLAIKQKLAVSRFVQGKYKDALKLFQEVLEVRQRVLGVDHPDTLETKDSIVETYNCLRKNNKRRKSL